MCLSMCFTLAFFKKQLGNFISPYAFVGPAFVNSFGFHFFDGFVSTDSCFSFDSLHCEHISKLWSDKNRMQIRFFILLSRYRKEKSSVYIINKSSKKLSIQDIYSTIIYIYIYSIFTSITTGDAFFSISLIIFQNLTF